jgi:hypothetical protein
MDPLGGINNFNQDPFAQQELYTKELAAKAKGAVTTTRIELDTGVTMHNITPGPFSNPTIDLSTPINPTNKVTETIMKDAKNGGSLTIFDLWDAQHAYPGPDRGAQINSTPKNPFDFTRVFAKEFNTFNEAEKKNS